MPVRLKEMGMKQILQVIRLLGDCKGAVVPEG